MFFVNSSVPRSPQMCLCVWWFTKNHPELICLLRRHVTWDFCRCSRSRKRSCRYRRKYLAKHTGSDVYPITAERNVEGAVRLTSAISGSKPRFFWCTGIYIRRLLRSPWYLVRACFTTFFVTYILSKDVSRLFQSIRWCFCIFQRFSFVILSNP